MNRSETSYKTVVANLKANGSNAFFKDYLPHLKSLKSVRHNLVICPAYPYIPLFAAALKNPPISIGGQDCSIHGPGSFTGEVPADFLKDVGASHVILGHSERADKEDAATIAQKLLMAVKAGLTPVLCLGESAETRTKGETEVFLKSRLGALLENVSGTTAPAGFCIAYEPIWSVGGTEMPDLSEIDVLCGLLREEAAALGVQASVFYGGSVSATNAGAIMDLPHVGGVLIGRAALDPQALSVMAA